MHSKQTAKKKKKHTQDAVTAADCPNQNNPGANNEKGCITKTNISQQLKTKTNKQKTQNIHQLQNRPVEHEDLLEFGSLKDLLAP